LSAPKLQACFKGIELQSERRQRQSKTIQFFRARVAPVHPFPVDWFLEYRFAPVGERSIDSAYCCGHCRRSAGLLTEYPRARRERRPLPDATLNALNNRIFYVSVFHRLKII
jgi:hypothetical protein